MADPKISQQRLKEAFNKCRETFPDNTETSDNCRTYATRCFIQSDDGKDTFELQAESGFKIILKSGENCLINAMYMAANFGKAAPLVSTPKPEKVVAPKEEGIHGAGPEVYEAFQLDQKSFKVYFLDVDEEVMLVDSNNFGSGGFDINVGGAATGDRVRVKSTGFSGEPVDPSKSDKIQKKLAEWGLPKLDDLNVDALIVYTKAKPEQIKKLKELCTAAEKDSDAILAAFKEFAALAQAVYPASVNKENALLNFEDLNGPFAKMLAKELGDDYSEILSAIVFDYAANGDKSKFDSMVKSWEKSDIAGYNKKVAEDLRKNICYQIFIVKTLSELADTSKVSAQILSASIAELESAVSLYNDKEEVGLKDATLKISAVKTKIGELKVEWCKKRAGEILAEFYKKNPSDAAPSEEVRAAILNLPSEIDAVNKKAVVQTLQEMLRGGTASAAKIKAEKIIAEAEGTYNAKASNRAQQVMNAKWRKEICEILDRAVAALIDGGVSENDPSFEKIAALRKQVYGEVVAAFVDKAEAHAGNSQNTDRADWYADAIKALDEAGKALSDGGLKRTEDVKAFTDIVIGKKKEVHELRVRQLIGMAGKQLMNAKNSTGAIDYKKAALETLGLADELVKKEGIDDNLITGDIARMRNEVIGIAIEGQLKAIEGVLDGVDSYYDKLQYTKLTVFPYQTVATNDEIERINKLLNEFMKKAEDIGAAEIYKPKVVALRKKLVEKFISYHVAKAEGYLRVKEYSADAVESTWFKSVSKELDMAYGYLKVSLSGEAVFDQTYVTGKTKELDQLKKESLAADGDLLVAKAEKIIAERTNNALWFDDFEPYLAKALERYDAAGANGDKHGRISDARQTAYRANFDSYYAQAKSLVENKPDGWREELNKAVKEMEKLITATVPNSEKAVFSGSQQNGFARAVEDLKNKANGK